MQYESHNKKTNNSFYIIIAVCAIAIGLVSYLAVVKTDTKNKNKNGNDSKNELSSDTSAYNSSEEDIENKKFIQMCISKIEEKQSRKLNVEEIKLIKTVAPIMRLTATEDEN